MAMYGTEAGMTAAFGADIMRDIADTDNSGAVDSGFIDAALERASSFADSFLAAYLPITQPIPNALERAVYDIANQQIRLGRGMGTDDSKLAYENAIKWLTMIAEGKISLFPEEGDDGKLDAGDPEMTAGDRVWTRALSRRCF